MNIIKINDKNFKVVDSKEVVYNLDELEQQLADAIAYNQKQDEIAEEVQQLPKYLQDLFTPLPYEDTTHIVDLINKLKSL